MQENIFIFHGENTPALKNHSQKWIDKFKDKYQDSFDLQIIEESKSFHFQNLILEAQTVPFLCEKKLIVAKNILSKYDKEFAKTLKKIPETTIILFLEYRKINKTDKLLGTLLKNANTTEFELNTQANKKLILETLQSTGANIPNKYLQILENTHEKNPNKLINSVKQIACYSHNQELNDEAFYKLADIQQEPNIFNFLDTIYTNKKIMLSQLKENLDYNPDPYKLLYMLIWHLKNLIQIKSNQTTGLKPFIINKHKKTASKINIHQIDCLLKDILKIDQMSKTGLIKGNKELALSIEMALVRNT